MSRSPETSGISVYLRLSAPTASSFASCRQKQITHAGGGEGCGWDEAEAVLM